MKGGGNIEDVQTQRIGIIGLGYVGLPLALLFVENGFDVVGLDIDPIKINHLSKGISYLTDINDEEIQSALSTGRFNVSDQYNLVPSLDAVIICVPTPLSDQHIPDLTYLQLVGEALSQSVRAEQLIILESSTFPGTTREVLQPILEKSGLKVGEDLFLAYSPERIDPGNKSYQVSQIPKVLSGISELCSTKAKELYSTVFDKLVMVSSPETAELTKLIENSQRFINISLMNELAIISEAMNINIWEAIEAASTKPYGFIPYYPGPGIGGHCIPVDPLYLLWKMQQCGQTSKFIELSQMVNQKMPHHILDRLEKLLPSNKSLKKAKILVYGVTYKPDINDIRESSATEIVKMLLQKGANLVYHDPFIPTLRVENEVLQSTDLTPQILQNTDCVLILVNHSKIPIQLLLEHAPLIFDTRNVTKGLKSNAKIIRLGEGVR